MADRIVLHRVRAKPLAGVVGGLLQPAIVKTLRFGLAIFQEQLALVGTRQPPRNLASDSIAVEIGAVEEGGCGVLGKCSVACSDGIKIVFKGGVARGAVCPNRRIEVRRGRYFCQLHFK